MKKLAIYRCSTHGYWAIVVDDENGGTRVTGSKCCGSWHLVHSFHMDSSDWTELSELARVAAKEAEAEEDEKVRRFRSKARKKN